MGIFVLGAIALYLLVAAGIVFAAKSYARRNGKSVKRWGWSAALVMYLVPFWDWLPTVAVHQYYCATESGFWVHKTMDQWRTENPGVMERLLPNLSTEHTSDGDLYTLDERFSIETHRRTPIPGLEVKVTDWLLVDRKTKETIAREVTVGSGRGNSSTGGGYKLWPSMKSCQLGGIARITREIENSRGKK